MHKFVMKKENLYIERYEPRFNQEKVDPATLLLEGGGELKGEVIAVSFDKFFLRQAGKVQPFMLGQDNEMPKVGQVYKVSYVSGRPPTCVTINPVGEEATDSKKAGSD